VPSIELALCDSGPLIALFDQRDSSHTLCREALAYLPARFVTTWPVLTETFHFLDREDQRDALWEWISSGGLVVMEMGLDEAVAVRQRMKRYRDLPMDLADASLVVVGERLGIEKVFTLDHHFHLFRPRHAKSFVVLP
jgi:uncharacterized protein